MQVCRKYLRNCGNQNEPKNGRVREEATNQVMNTDNNCDGDVTTGVDDK